VVHSADGQTAEAYHTVFTESCGDPYRIATAEKEPSFNPNGIALKDASPNPFSSSTKIEFYLPESQEAKLEVTDLTGRPVQVLAEGVQEAGWHQKEFSSEALKGGVYFYRLKTRNYAQTERLILIR